MRSGETRRRWGLGVARSEIEEEVGDELRFHLECKADRLVQQGVPAHEARAEAERRFGAVESIREQCVELSLGRERKRMRMERITDLARDLRHACRGLMRRPGFTATAVLTIALGLGAVTSIFSLLDAVLLRSLPYDQADRLTTVWRPFQSEAVFLAMQELDVFEDVAAVANQSLTLNGEGRPLRVSGSAVTANLFDVLRTAPVAGRLLQEADADPGAESVAVIAERLASSRFGSPEAAIGEALRLEGEQVEVVGVMPDRLRIPSADTQVWLPQRIEAASTGYHWGSYHLQLIGRLAPEVTAQQAELQVRAKAKQLRELNPIWTPGETYGDTASVAPLQTTMAGNLARLLRLLMWASLAVLLVACVNVANLLLARSSARERETAIRSSLGAGRGRLITSLLLESLVISTLGAVAGLVIALGSVRVLTAALPSADARFGDIGVDLRVLAFTITATVLTALVFGLVPALRHSRADLSAGMTAGARGGRSSARRWTKALVVVQLALSVVLLFSAGLVMKSLWRLWTVDLGFERSTVMLARLDPASGDYQDRDRRVDLYREVIRRLEASPMVETAAASSLVPMSSAGQTVFDVPALELDPNDLPGALTGDVTPGFFETIGLPLLRGRGIEVTDGRRDECTTTNPCVTVVNQRLAEQMFDGEPLGEVIGAGFYGYFEIVGVVADARLQALDSEPTMAFFRPHPQRPEGPMLSLELLVKGNGSPRDLTALIESAVAAVDPQVPVDNFRTLEATIRGSVSETRFLASLLGVFAAVSLLLGGIGVYGVISFMVEERRQELGVRAALGATPQNLRRQVLWQALGLTGIGIGLGALGSVAVTRLLEGQLFETSAFEPELLVSIPAALMLAAALSAWLPARRAARLDPVKVLREE